MKNIIASIRDAIEKEAYLPALALALTIPDVCGSIAYPELKGEDSSKERYHKWFREYVERFYPDEKGITRKGNARNAFMNAKACYDLRNSIFHSGTADIHVSNKRLFGKELDAPQFNYELFVNSANGYGYLIANNMGENQAETVRIRLDIGAFCENVCNAAEDFGEKAGNVFREHDIRYVDIKAYTEKRDALQGTDNEVDWDAILQAVNDESNAVVSPQAGGDK